MSVVLPEQVVPTWSHHLKCKMISWGKGVHKSTIQDAGNIITKHKELRAYVVQPQILMALVATSIEAKLKTS